jgi:RND superfamily putative drug exporter
VIWGLSTDYEVFLVSRMVEARERGMSTAEAIRIGTATTGRLITGAALILAVVAGAFVFSDLVMMKYLAFGLLIALLLDATIIRMFLVPAIMKLLGDDCWWAPRWMKRIQEKLGLGETELPDERKRPTVRESDVDQRALVGVGAPPPPPRPHDPTHPAPEPVRPVPPMRANAPSAAGTARISAPPQQPPQQQPQQPPQQPPLQQPQRQPGDEPATTRFAMARNAVRNAVNSAVNTATGSAPTERAPRPGGPVQPPAPPQREEREIESWLGALRGPAVGKNVPQPPPAQPPRPSTDATRAMPPQGRPQDRSQDRSQDSAPTTAFSAQRPPNGGAPADATTAIPVPPQREPDPSTEKLDTRADAPDDQETKRRGGGMSAQDLLRREGRL